jgi:hypothetical protein
VVSAAATPAQVATQVYARVATLLESR